MDNKVFEVCVDNIISCENAVKGGANRLELCQDLILDGVTPSYGLISAAKKVASSIPVFVLVRPRHGNFIYSSSEIDVMVHDIKNAYAMGADGIVTGALTSDNKIDVENCSKLRSAVPHIPMTFHRAFDFTVNPRTSLNTIIDLGFQRILTSGCKPTCLEGAPLIKELIAEANDRIIIVPAGGINATNLELLLDETGAIEFHASTLVTPKPPSGLSSLLQSPGSNLSNYQSCDSQRVAILSAVARNFWLH